MSRHSFGYMVLSILGMSYAAMGQTISRTQYYDEEKTRMKERYEVRQDDHSVLEGDYTSYYSSGKIESEGQFKNNEASGLWKFYFETGKIKMRMEVTGKEEGYWEYFFENGNKSMEGRIEEKKRQGNWVIYYESGAAKSSGLFEDSRMEGEWTFYYEDGKTKGEAIYSNNKGGYTEYYQSGEVKAKGWKQGFLNTDTWVFYYAGNDEMGRLVPKARGNYQNGRKIGYWEYFFQNGRVSASGYFNNNKPHGDWTYYYEDGTVNSKGGYSDGMRNGSWSFFYEDGSPQASGQFVNGTGNYKEFHPGGQLKSEGGYYKGKRQGEWVFYYPSGKTEGVATYENGIGEYEGYFEKTGQVKTMGGMEGNKKTGTWEIYEENGELSGYYKPFYGQSRVPEDLLDFTPPSPEDKPQATYAYSRPGFNYFKDKGNEFHGLIFGTNPLFLFVGRWPINLEFYVQERLGHEFEFEAIRDPFFTKDIDIPLNEIYKRGYSIAIRQKFYNTSENPGLWYFGHEFQFANLTHNANVVLPSLPDTPVKINATEQNAVYHVLFGYRLMENRKNKGYTIDAFTGVGIGYRNFTVADEYSESFLEIPQNAFPVSFRFGLNIGYVFPFGGLR